MLNLAFLRRLCDDCAWDPFAIHLSIVQMHTHTKQMNSRMRTTRKKRRGEKSRSINSFIFRNWTSETAVATRLKIILISSAHRRTLRVAFISISANQNRNPNAPGFFPTATSVGKNDDGSRHLCWIEINLINSARIYPEIALFVAQLKNTNDEKVTTTKCSIWQKFLIHSSIPVRFYSFCRVFISQKSTSQTHSHRNLVHLSNLTMVRERISIDRQTKQQQKE